MANLETQMILLRIFSNLLARKVHYLDEILSSSQIKIFRKESLELTAESLRSIGNECQGLHSISFEGVPLDSILSHFFKDIIQRSVSAGRRHHLISRTYWQTGIISL